MNAPILFVAADPRECAPWVARWHDVRDLRLPVHWARAGRWRGSEMIAIANGAGWERAAAAVRAVPGLGAVFNIGFCGALDQSLAIGDVVIGTEVCSGGSRYPARGVDGRGAKSGTVASVSRIARTAAEKRKLRETGASVVEMEAAGVARAAMEAGLPFYCVRAVSDLADEDFANDFNQCLMPDGRFSVSRLVVGAMSDPIRKFGELIRLSKRTALASKSLGEFLANCGY